MSEADVAQLAVIVGQIIVKQLFRVLLLAVVRALLAHVPNVADQRRLCVRKCVRRAHTWPKQGKALKGAPRQSSTRCAIHPGCSVIQALVAVVLTCPGEGPWL